MELTKKGKTKLWSMLYSMVFEVVVLCAVPINTFIYKPESTVFLMEENCVDCKQISQSHLASVTRICDLEPYPAMSPFHVVFKVFLYIF